jgi:hypothetical protein
VGQSYTRPVVKEFIEGSIAIAKASIAEEVADALRSLAVPCEVVEYATFDLRFNAESKVNEDYASFIDSAAEACTASAFVAEDVAAAAAVAQPVSSVAAEEASAAPAAVAADACTAAAAERPAATAEAHTAVAAMESSSEVDTSAGPGEHTKAAGVVEHSKLAAAGASGIVVEPSFEAEVDIGIESRASNQHLHDYL